MASSLIGFGDVYGNSGIGENTPPTPTQAASGNIPQGNDKSPAFSWVALIAVLVAIRVLSEFAKEA